MTRTVDVEQAVKELLAQHSRVMLPDSAPTYAKIQYRNIAIPVSFMRMALSEANRGSPTGDVLIAAAQMVAQFIENFGAPYDREQQQAIQDAFIGLLVDTLKTSRRSKKNRIVIASVDLGDKGGLQ